MSSDNVKRPVYFLISHPIQYYAPLFKKMTEEGIDLEVWYCSDETIKEFHDKQFNSQVKWDIPLLDGYDYIFLKNNAWKPSIFNGFFGLLNWSVLKLLLTKPKGVIITHGWNRATMLLAILLARVLGHQLFMRSENPLTYELAKPFWNRVVKQVTLRFIFNLCNKVLYIGNQNRLFYQYYGVSDRKLVFTPYSVDNDRFHSEAEKRNKTQIRHQYHIDSDTILLLFCGKYIDKKAPLDLLKAFRLCHDTSLKLLMVGEGELRPQMEHYINEHQLQDRVVLTGFINQTQISDYYSMADIFILPSDHGETWGLVANEAMNFNLPVIVSDRVGSAYDLIEEGQTGYIFPFGDIHQMAKSISKMVEKVRAGFVPKSSVKIKKYSYEVIIDSIKKNI
jgi:glycosyltransferase involved in cell wall biosynthesis